MNSEPLISAEKLGLNYGDRQILHNVDLTVKPGEIVTIIGPSGAGKTSLLRIILGLQSPNAGILVKKKDLKVGYLPQKLQLHSSMPLDVAHFLALASRDTSSIASNLSLCGAEHLLHQPLHSLSGGETQRVLLARALTRNPEILILDEPMQGVDVVGQAKLYELLQTIREDRQCGVLMVSHDLHLVMAATDHVVCLNGHVCCEGHPHSVSEHPAYLELFGRGTASNIALYTHHHNHTHDGPEPTHEHGAGR